MRCHVLGGYIYYGEEKSGGRGSEEAGERGNNGILRVESGGTVRGIDFRFAPFKRGTWRSYDSSDGLTSMYVHDIHQDREGMQWCLDYSQRR